MPTYTSRQQRQQATPAAPRPRAGAARAHHPVPRLIDTPGDPYERAADQVADAVAGRPATVSGSFHRPPPSAPSAVGRGGGQPLPPAVRAFMEPRLAFDFRQVRIHTDAEAAQASHALGARALTQGPDIYFGAGAYNPGSYAGQHLLAHELAHVVQQSRTPAAGTPAIQRQTKPPANKPNPAVAGVQQLIATNKGGFGLRHPFKKATIKFLQDGLAAAKKAHAFVPKFVAALQQLLIQLIDDLNTDRIKVEFLPSSQLKFGAQYVDALNTIQLEMPNIGSNQNLLTQPHQHTGEGVDMGPMLEKIAVEAYEKLLPDLGLQLIHEYQHLLDDRILEQAVLQYGGRETSLKSAYRHEKIAFQQEAYFAQIVGLKPRNATFLGKVFKMFEASASATSQPEDRYRAHKSLEKTAEQNYKKHYSGTYPLWSLRVTIAKDASVRLFMPKDGQVKDGSDIDLGKLTAAPSSPSDLQQAIVAMLNKLPAASQKALKQLGRVNVVVFQDQQKVPLEFGFTL